MGWYTSFILKIMHKSLEYVIKVYNKRNVSVHWHYTKDKQFGPLSLIKKIKDFMTRNNKDVNFWLLLRLIP